MCRFTSIYKCHKQRVFLNFVGLFFPSDLLSFTTWYLETLAVKIWPPSLLPFPHFPCSPAYMWLWHPAAPSSSSAATTLAGSNQGKHHNTSCPAWQKAAHLSTLLIFNALLNLLTCTFKQLLLQHWQSQYKQRKCQEILSSDADIEMQTLSFQIPNTRMKAFKHLGTHTENKIMPLNLGIGVSVCKSTELQSKIHAILHSKTTNIKPTYW